MSNFVSTGSSLKSTNLPAAMFEAALFLDNAEKARNGANPGLTPKSNIAVTVSSDEGIASITASLPADVSIDATTGSILYNAKDYLGGTYAVFTGGGDVVTASAMDAFVIIAQRLSMAEKLIQPAEDQPNFVQIESSSESGLITVTATLPYVGSILPTGQFQVTMIDYL
jgi:hypothetical protein